MATDKDDFEQVVKSETEEQVADFDRHETNSRICGEGFELDGGWMVEGGKNIGG